MKSRFFWVIAILCFFNCQASAQCTNGMWLDGKVVLTGTGGSVVPDWHALADIKFVVRALNAARFDVDAKCSPKLTPIVSIILRATNAPPGRTIIEAWWSRADDNWRITGNGVSTLETEEKEELARKQQEEEAKRQEEDAAKQAQLVAAAKEDRRKAALADCGSAPGISGGPWFSSTYKTAVTDAARNYRFLCVKNVEYIGAAVNVFGGNAARAKFTGYDASNYDPLAVVMDFPY
jgi:hypothetical protein